MSAIFHLVGRFGVMAAQGIFYGALGWFLIRRSKDPRQVFIRLAVTVVVVWGGILLSGQFYRLGGPVQIMVVPVAAAMGLILAVVWVPSLMEFISDKIGSLYTGGDAELELQPFYSIYHALHKKGDYPAAEAELRRQLAQFPTDYEGQMLLARLQANNLNDLPAAEATVQQLCVQPGHTPRNVALALNELADWHLRLNKDREAACKILEQVKGLFPETEMALQAAQRIGRLSDANGAAVGAPRRIEVRPGAQRLGLGREKTEAAAAVVPPEQEVLDCVKHLDAHPLDAHVRERLAILYANHYHRLDLAVEHLEQLISQPAQPPKNVMKWLNLLADLQIQEGKDVAAAGAALRRIIELYPDSAAAQNATRRLDTLKLELKGSGERHPVRLGVYEQNLGLKRRQG